VRALKIVKEDYFKGEFMMHGDSMYFSGGILMWLLFLIIIVLLIYFIVRSMQAKDTGFAYKETPLDILKKRYAKGEITKEEFDKIRKDLE